MNSIFGQWVKWINQKGRKRMFGTTSKDEKKGGMYMDTKSFDVLVAKEFEVDQGGGKVEKRTAWNRVGRAWPGRNPEAIGFELFLFPGQKYILHMGQRLQKVRTPFETFDSIGGEHV